MRDDKDIMTKLIREWRPQRGERRSLWFKYYSQFHNFEIPEDCEVITSMTTGPTVAFYQRMANRITAGPGSATARKIWEIYRKLSEHNKVLHVVNVFGFESNMDKDFEGDFLVLIEQTLGRYARSYRAVWLPGVVQQNIDRAFRDIINDTDLYLMRLQHTMLSEDVSAAIRLLRRRAIVFWNFNVPDENFQDEEPALTVLHQANSPDLPHSIPEMDISSFELPRPEILPDGEFELSMPDSPMPGSFAMDFTEVELQQYPGLFDRVKQLRDSISNGISKAANTHELLDSVLTGMQKTFGPGGTVDASFKDAVLAIETGAGNLQKQMEELSGHFPKFEDLKAAFMKYLLPILTAICGYFRERHEAFRVLFYAGMGLLIAHWGPKLFGKLDVLFSNQVREQAIGASWVKDFFTVLSPVMGFTQSLSDNVYTRLLDAFYWHGDVVHEVFVLEIIATKAIAVWEALKRLTGWATPDFKTFVSGHKDLDDFVKEVLPIVECESLIPDEHNIQAVDKLYNVVAHLRNKYSKDSAVQRTLDHFHTQLAKLHKEFSRIKSDSPGLRHEPVGIMLYGDPGVGKSLCQGMLVKRLMDMITADNPAMKNAYDRAPDRFVYRRRGGPYYEGCFPTTKVVSFPDFGAEKANENSSAKHEHEMIQLISNEPYEPEMAFEMKGKLRISPDFVICTTNNTKVHGDTIVHKDAFARRFIIAKLTWAHDGKPIEGQDIDTDGWQFNIATCDKSTSYSYKLCDPAVQLNYDQFTTMIGVALKLNKERFYKADAFMRSDKFNPQELCNMVKNLEVVPGRKPWDYVIHQARYSMLFSTRDFEKEVKLDFNEESGFPDGSFAQRLLAEDGTKYTEDNYLPDRKITKQVLDTFHAKMLPVPVLAERWFSFTDGVVKIRVPFELNTKHLLALQTLYCGDPLMLPRTFLTTAPEHRSFGEGVLLGLLRLLYKRAGVYIRSPTMDMFRELYERDAMLTWYCLVNRLDVQAAKALVSPKLTDIVGSQVAILLDAMKENVRDLGYVAMLGIMTSIAIVVPVFGIIRVASSALPTHKVKPIESKALQQASAYVDQKNLIKLKRVPPKKAPILAKNVEFQASEVFLTGQMVSAKAQWQLLDSAGEVVTNVLALGGRKFVMNDHTYVMIKDAVDRSDHTDHCLTMKRGDECHDIPVREFLTGIRIEDKDVFWFKLPSMPECRDIKAHWVPEGYVESFMLDQMRYFSMASNIPGKGLQTSRAQLIGSRTIEGLQRAQLWRCAAMNSTRGDCGSACFVGSTGPAQGKIAGILQSGEEGMGLTYFCAITRYEMETMCARLEGQQAPERDDGKKMIVGHVPIGHNFSSSINDILVPSEYPAKEPFKAPVDINDPMVYNLARKPYCPSFEPSTDALSRFRTCVQETLESMYQKATTPLKKGTKTYVESIVGNPGTAFKSVPLKTSPGTPYNIEPQCSKKALLGHFDGDKFVFGDRSQEMFDRTVYYLEQLQHGEVPCDVFTDIVKSELLPREKVANGKGRLVSACPTVRSLVFRILYGNLMEWLMENCNTNGIAAGMNMMGDDAHMMIMRHLAVSGGADTHCSGDLSKNDARQTQECLTITMEEFNSFMNRHGCMTPIHFRMCETFAKSYKYKFHLRGDVLDMWKGSLDSGDPATWCVNSVSNAAYARYSIWKAQGFPEVFHELYNANVESDFLGDDNWHSCSPAWAHYMTGTTMSDGYADFGHVWTDDSKQSSDSQLRPITQIGYLKRTPRFEPYLGKWLMALDLDTTLEIGLWTQRDGKKGQVDIDQALTNVDTMCLHLSYHSDEVWNEWLPRFERMYAEYGWEPKSRDRRTVLSKVYGQKALVL